MLSYFDLRKGTLFIYEGKPCEVLDFSQTFKGRGSATANVKIRNLVTGEVIEKTFHQGDEFEEAEIEEIEVLFIYSHRGKFVFSEKDNPGKRFELKEEQIGKQARFLKPNTVVKGLKFEGKIINVLLPIKVNLKVIEAPPGLKGDRAQGGTKTVKLETGAKVNTPLFIKEGDIIEVNTRTGEYVRRIIR